MHDLFPTYKGDYDYAIAELKKEIKYVSTESKKNLEKCRIWEQEVNDALDNMKSFVKANPGTSKVYSPLISSCQNEVNQVKAQLDKLATEALFSGGKKENEGGVSLDDTLQGTTEKIDEAERVGQDVIRVGAGIMKDLDDQGKK